MWSHFRLIITLDVIISLVFTLVQSLILWSHLGFFILVLTLLHTYSSWLLGPILKSVNKGFIYYKNLYLNIECKLLCENTLSVFRIWNSCFDYYPEEFFGQINLYCTYLLKISLKVTFFFYFFFYNLYVFSFEVDLVLVLYFYP